MQGEPQIAAITAGRRQVSVYKIIPSLLTIMAMIAGVTSIQMAINDRYDTAV